MSAVTRLLERWNAGDSAAMPELLAVVYDELRQMADRVMRTERDDHTLQPTALVNELYLKFVGLRELRLENRRHFYGAAAEAMRRILVDHARTRNARKRGGGEVVRIALDDVPDEGLVSGAGIDFEQLDTALAAFRQVFPERAAVVDLRYFAGLSIDETAQVLEISRATVVRHWTFARAWLYREMQ